MVRNSLNHQQRHSSQKECQFLLFVVSIARIVANSWASNTTATPMKEVKQLIAAPVNYLKREKIIVHYKTDKNEK